MILNFYCCLTYAALPLGEKLPRNAVWHSLLGVVYILEYVLLGGGWVQLAVGICFLTTALLHLLIHIRQNRE